MEFVPVSLSASDIFPPLIMLVLVLVIGIIFCVAFRDYSAFGYVVAFALFFAVLVAIFHIDSHKSNQRQDIRSNFEQSYDLTIIKGDIPFETGTSPAGLTVYLNDIPGRQDILVTIQNGHYVVTHDGELREVQND